ncbi:hypothetical protein DIPPA_10141 [Diplonema papillatum]|nr:hypothetical protein DIPPA_10141 [Diplonema papillatum]
MDSSMQSLLEQQEDERYEQLVQEIRLRGGGADDWNESVADTVTAGSHFGTATTNSSLGDTCSEYGSMATSATSDGYDDEDIGDLERKKTALEHQLLALLSESAAEPAGLDFVVDEAVMLLQKQVQQQQQYIARLQDELDAARASVAVARQERDEARNEAASVCAGQAGLEQRLLVLAGEQQQREEDQAALKEYERALAAVQAENQRMHRALKEHYESTRAAAVRTDERRQRLADLTRKLRVKDEETKAATTERDVLAKQASQALTELRVLSAMLPVSPEELRSSLTSIESLLTNGEDDDEEEDAGDDSAQNVPHSRSSPSVPRSSAAGEFCAEVVSRAAQARLLDDRLAVVAEQLRALAQERDVLRQRQERVDGRKEMTLEGMRRQVSAPGQSRAVAEKLQAIIDKVDSCTASISASGRKLAAKEAALLQEQHALLRDRVAYAGCEAAVIAP